MEMAQSNVKSLQISAKIIRADGTVENLGTIQYWSQNSFKRLLWRIKKWLQY